MMIAFTRDFCLPCQLMKPWIRQLRAGHQGKVDVVAVNIDRARNDHYAQRFGITTVPTQVFVSASGQVETRHVGTATQDEMDATLMKLGWLR